MKLLRSYIGSHLCSAILLILCVVSFSGTALLYRTETEAVLYAMMLSVLVSTPIVIVDYCRYVKTYRKLQSIHQSMDNIEEYLTRGTGLLEQEYYGIIEDMAEEKRQMETEHTAIQQESKEYYTAWIHQIKVPISAMSLILQEEDSAEYQELRAELFRIEQYVTMVLSYARLTSNSTDFVFKEYSLDAIIRQSIRKYANQFIRKKIHLRYEGTTEKVLTDEKWLSFLIEQLLSNTVKYTEEGEVVIQVSDKKILSVSDTGIGIASEDLPRIFENGFTGYNGRTDRKSTGLGLYLCKCTAEQLSCEVWAESTVGQGTTIYVDLNCVELKVE